MNAISAPKSPQANWLEGFALTAIFQGLPSFAAAVLVLKMIGTHQAFGHGYGAAIFVVSATLLSALVTTSLSRKFPNRFMHRYEPLFFDASLSFGEKITRWSTQPVPSQQLVGIVMVLSLLAVGVGCVG